MPRHSSSLAIILGVVSVAILLLVLATIIARRRGFSGIGGNTIVR